MKLLLALGLCLIVDGCSNSTSQPTTTYPLQLAFTAPSNKLSNILYCTIQVTSNGTPVRGAKLTALASPSLALDTVNVRSDSTGTFVFGYTFQNADVEVAFRAIKDTLLSNYVRWP